jgi:hypothetical protein
MRRYPNYRTVSIDTSGGVMIQVHRVNNWFFYVCALAVLTLVAGSSSWMLVAAMLRSWSVKALVLLLPLLFILLWFAVCSRIAVERLCTVELAVSEGCLRWSYGISRWRRAIEVAQQDVVAITAKHHWYGNRLLVAVRATAFRLDDLLDEDLETITRELRRALPGAKGS